MLREIRVYLGFRLDIFEDWFLLVEREMNNVQSLKSFFVGIARSIRLRRLGWAHWLPSFVLISLAFYIGLKGKENCFSLPPTPLYIDVWAAIVVDGSLITFT